MRGAGLKRQDMARRQDGRTAEAALSARNPADGAPGGEGGGVHGRSIEEALEGLASEGAQPLRLGLGLDPLGRDTDVHAPQHADEPLEQRGRAGIAVRTDDEAAMELHPVDGQDGEMGEGGVASAEVVEIDPQAGRAQFGQHVDHARAAPADAGFLQNFDGDVGPLKPYVGRQREDAPGNPGTGEGGVGQIDRYPA